jgi:2-desacetyl-2-hydroxyethyl bacteriochlorophyllide A dehydrogenase
MQAAVITGARAFEVTDVPDPSPTPGEVVLEVAASGICGTDLQIFAGDYPAALPVVPGHEFAGTVVDLGADVHTLRVGDRVAADPNVPCRRCPYCHDGRVNLCDNYAALGVTMNGACARFVTVPEYLCVPVPAQLDLLHAALAEPLSCALHAWDLVGPQVGRSAVIYGSGTMGLMMLQLAGLFGVTGVDLVDVNPGKLEAARMLGAGRVATDAADALPERGWDVVIDASGSAAAIADGLTRVAKGGTFLQFGVAAPDVRVEIDPFDIYEREIRILGAVCPLNSFARSLHLLATGVVKPEPLVSDTFSLGQYGAALDKFARGSSRKVLIAPAQ